MHTLLERLQSGLGTPSDLRRLELLGDVMKHTSLCGLGQSAPNPVFGSLRYFRREYEERLQVSDAHPRIGPDERRWDDVESAESPLRPQSVVSVKSADRSRFHLTIDDRSVPATRGQTLLQVARAADIGIPTLCHFDGLSEAAACRLCLVEVAGRPKLAPACVTTAERGMVVRTRTPRLREYRRVILELFFAERNHVCAACVANGECELQDLATRHGMDHVRWDYRYPEYRVDLSHARFGLDPNRCILCTRCVRICGEIEGAHTLDVAGRGADSWIIADFDQSWGESSTCTACGKCVAVCPTGALFPKETEIAGLRHADRRRGRIELVMLAREGRP
jgi:bidirectional [NiFe] hydrogenase diaphorase subunit